MIISFAWAKRCARCKRRVARTDKSYMNITPLEGRLRMTVRFRFCSDCFAEVARGMKRVHDEHLDTTMFSHDIEGLG